MIRPAGYSSEDNSYDEFEDDFHYYSNVKTTKKHRHHVITEQEKQERKLAEIYRLACFGNTDGIMEHIDEGFDVNTQLTDNWTLLLVACSIGNLKLANELIKTGADVNAARDLFTPLMAACSCPPTTSPFEVTANLVEALTLAGAVVNAKSRTRMTALMYASSAGNYDAVVKLLPLCDKHDMDNQGWTALHWAVNDKRKTVVPLLLEAGLDPTKSDVRGLKPLDYAKSNNSETILNMLPDPDRDKTFESLKKSSYDFQETMCRPRFWRDVAVMLHGMDCPGLVKQFEESGMDLLSFLSLTKDDLVDMGVSKPYQQNRILGGLFRFHKHSLKSKAIPIVPKTQEFTTADLATSMLAAMRHVTTLHGSLNYLENNLPSWSDDELDKGLQEIDQHLELVKMNMINLKGRIKEWDAENEPVDLITKYQCGGILQRYKWFFVVTTFPLVICYCLKKLKSM